MTDDDVPDRPGRRSRRRLWAEAVALLVASGALLWAVTWAVLDDGQVVGREGRLLITGVPLAVVLVWNGTSWARSAWTLSMAPGRYALVLDERSVSWRTGWFRTTTAHWIQLAELDGRPIGWAQIGSARWTRLEGEHVVAVWGEPGQVQHLVLSGSFPVTRVLGQVTSAEPTPG